MRKNILITGASSGLGAGMAREFARKGRNLALCARRMDRVEELKAELLAANPGIRVVTRELDVNNCDQVFAVFKAFREDLGSLDRVIVNAGMGKGASLGTGYFRANQQTAQTNFVAAIAQCEAAMEIFRAQNAGHLVMIASIAAMRGMPRAQTVYAATKAGVSALAEGIRLDVSGTPIVVSTMYPGYIKSEINAKVRHTPFMVDTESGCRSLVAAIESEKARAYVPAWPWTLIGWALRNLPASLTRKFA